MYTLGSLYRFVGLYPDKCGVELSRAMTDGIAFELRTTAAICGSFSSITRELSKLGSAYRSSIIPVP
jgi:hypothetical protein